MDSFDLEHYYSLVADQVYDQKRKENSEVTFVILGSITLLNIESFKDRFLDIIIPEITCT